MTPVFASRRRAEEFHSLVDAPRTGAARSGVEGRHEEFLAIVESLRAVPSPEPRPEFVASLREELLSAADTLLLPASNDRLTLPPRNGRRDRRVAAAIGGLAVVGAGTSMAMAAQTALPGEMLYPLKRAIESAQVEAASGRDTEALALLDSATSRLDELQELGREGELATESAAVRSNFVDFGTQADRAADLILADHAETGDRALVRRLRDFTGSSMVTLEALEAAVPPAVHDELLAAVEVISEIDARAQRACPGCGGQGVTHIPPVLLSSAATDSEVVVIPGATVKAWRPRGAERRAGADRGDRDGGPTGGVRLTGPLATGPVTTGPVTGGGGQGPGGAPAPSGATGPLGELTGTLTGGGGPPAPNGGDVDVDVDLDLDVGGIDVGGTVGDTLDETEEQVDETVDELTDPLLGD